MRGTATFKHPHTRPDKILEYGGNFEKLMSSELQHGLPHTAIVLRLNVPGGFGHLAGEKKGSGKKSIQTRVTVDSGLSTGSDVGK